MGLIDGFLGGFDQLYFLLANRVTAKNPPLFRQGWGSDAAIEAVIARFRSPGHAFEIQPEWDGGWTEASRCRFRDGYFGTPMFREFLPKECALARFRVFQPATATKQVVVMVPTRFEQGCKGRQPLAFQLAAHGIASVLLESPFMGRRKPDYQPTPMLASLSDFVLLGGTAIEEARSAVSWLQREGFEKICVTGISLGGYLAAVAGASAKPPVAIVMLLAPHDGNVVYIDGLSRSLCHWPEMQRTCGSAEPVEAKFRAVFDAISLERIPEPETSHRIIALGASSDRFVPPGSFRRMARHWPASELRWIRGGHISSILRRRHYFEAILDALSLD
jgi:hypothetical protein